MKKTTRIATSVILVISIMMTLSACSASSVPAENTANTANSSDNTSSTIASDTSSAADSSNDTGSAIVSDTPDASNTSNTSNTVDTIMTSGTTNTIDIIMTAGTTQAFSEEIVPEEDIQTILEAGLAAESAINQQPWYFVAITDQDVMKEISSSGRVPGSGTESSFPKDGEIPSAAQGGNMPSLPQDEAQSSAAQDSNMPSLPQDGASPSAPQGNAPSSMGNGSAKASLGDSPLAIVVYMDENTASPNPTFDCGLAVQNMYLAAASLGYGVKIVTSPTMSLNGANHDQVCEKLGVDPSLTAVAVLLVGKADDTVDLVSSASTRAGLNEKSVIIG